jgi:hypothetical protein
MVSDDILSQSVLVSSQPVSLHKLEGAYIVKQKTLQIEKPYFEQQQSAHKHTTRHLATSDYFKRQFFPIERSMRVKMNAPSCQTSATRSTDPKISEPAQTNLGKAGQM